MNNFTKRLIFGAIYVILILIATLTAPKYFLFLFFIFMNFCLYEFLKMMQIKSIYPYIIGFISYYVINYLDKINWSDPSSKIIISLSIFTLFFIFIKILFTNKNPFDHLGKLFLSYIYIIVPFSLLLFIPLLTQGTKPNTKLVLGVFIFLWTNDTFAYLVGRKIGKHKLFERISPKKTIEGFIGGLVFTLITSFIIAHFFTFLALKHWIAIALIVSIFGTIGDLIESMFKRQANIKDSSNLIPGHGGFLDRLDSFIFAIPFIFIYLTLFI